MAALRAAAASAGHGQQGGIERVIAEAAERLGEPIGDAALGLFGYAAGTRGADLKTRRIYAAKAYGVSFHTFREKSQSKAPSRERTTVEQIAETILALCAEQELRAGLGHLERNEQTDERIAYQWVRRFESYFRLWTPTYALAADLTAYRSSLLDATRPWDRAPGTDGPDDAGETQEGQAEGYARFALFRYAEYELALRSFVNRHGGLWLLSDADAERDVADAIYRIGWHTGWNERDQSWLRITLHAAGRELHPFLIALADDDFGRATHQEWQDWARRCRCTWPLDTDNEKEFFPTARHHRGVSDDCPVHLTVAACNDYCDLIEREWRRIADAFHISDAISRGISPEMLYRRHRPESTRPKQSESST
jgi:hypothetical protein